MAEDKKQSPVPEAHTTPEAPAPKTPGGPAVEEQATIPGMESGPAPSGKVIDLSDVRGENFVRVSANEVWLRSLEASRLAIGSRFFLMDPGNAYQISY